MNLLDCKTCAKASVDRWLSKKEEHKFELCESCSKEIESMKSSSKVIKSFTQGPFHFQISKQEEKFKIDLTLSLRDELHSTLEDNVLSVQECEESIKLWLNRPFKMGGSLANIF